jgi:hypothetical protein
MHLFKEHIGHDKQLMLLFKIIVYAFIFFMLFNKKPCVNIIPYINICSQILEEQRKEKRKEKEKEGGRKEDHTVSSHFPLKYLYIYMRENSSLAKKDKFIGDL